MLLPLSKRVVNHFVYKLFLRIAIVNTGYEVELSSLTKDSIHFFYVKAQAKAISVGCIATPLTKKIAILAKRCNKVVSVA